MESLKTVGLDSPPRSKAGPEPGENWIPEDVAQWLDHIGISHESNGGLPLYNSYTGAFALDDSVLFPLETVPITLNNDSISLTSQTTSLPTQPTYTLARETGDAALVFASYPCVSTMQEDKEEGQNVLSSPIQGQPGVEGRAVSVNDNPMQYSLVAPLPMLQQHPSTTDPSTLPSSDSQPPPYPFPFPPHVPALRPPQFSQLRWARQEPQGQEQQADRTSLEKHGLSPPHCSQPTLLPASEDLPSYEQVKAQTQGLRQLQEQLFYTLGDQESPPSPSRTPDSQPSVWTNVAPYSIFETSSPNTDPSSSPSPPLGPKQGFTCGVAEQEGLSTWSGAGDGDFPLRGVKECPSLSQKFLQLTMDTSVTPPANAPSPSYLLSLPPSTGFGDPRGPPPDYPFNSCHPLPSSPSWKPQPSFSDLGPLLSDPSSPAGTMDWCTGQLTRADSSASPECQSRKQPTEKPSVEQHSPTPSQNLFSQNQAHTHTSTFLPKIQIQTSTVFSQPQLQQAGPVPSGAELVMAANVQQMVQLLCKENQTMRQELQTQVEKASRLHWLEAELQRISDDYNWLMSSSAKREGLDRTMRCKLEGEIRRLTVFNRDLRDRLETANQQLACYKPEEENDRLAAELREGLLEKERLEEEVEEQRLRVERLESALNSAQQRAQHLKEELRVKCVYAARVEGLQHALVQLQTACEKREQLERRLRTRLERELQLMRTQQRTCGMGNVTAGQAVCMGEGSAPALRELLRQREERVLALQADSTRWEQKYLQENAMRHFTMETPASAGKHRDNLGVHSRSGSYSEMTGQPLWHEDDAQQSNRQCNDMENRIRDLYAQLIEKDALIKVLQQRNSRRDLTVLRPASSTPSISTATGLHSRQASQTDKGREERKEGRSLIPSLPLLSSLPPSSPLLSRSSSTLPYSSSSSVSLSSALPLSSFPHSTLPPSLPHYSSLPSTPLLSSHSKTGSRDSSTQTDKGSENLKVLPLPSRAWLGLAKNQRTDGPRNQHSHMEIPDTDILEILI